MVELYPAPFTDLVDRLHLEFDRQQAIFELPCRKWYVPDPAGPDLGVLFHGRHAGTPVGPASGPQNQMAQNLVLSWLAGSRIIEFKTVQINDQLIIPRPCIDAVNVCYNVEWSQELRIAQSLREYVAGAMLIHILRRGNFFNGLDLAGPLGDTIFDMSVGYDLAGIQAGAVTGFIRDMRDISGHIDRLRLQIPARHHRLRDLDYPTCLSTSITLSTFHGCPADEIERICAYLLTELDVDVVAKMNPPMLGKQRLEHLLYDVMGYHHLKVNPTAYETTLQFDEAVDICTRLKDLAAKRGRHFGAKFTNTLEVLNHRTFFTPDNKVMYLSGQPLHVISLTLAEMFRRAMGPDLPLTFSAGVDQHNFADMVAAGFCPVTTCTDLLRVGGFGRLPRYLTNLTTAMGKVGAAAIDDFILDAYGQREPADGDKSHAAAANMAIVAEKARNDERYWAKNNNSEPKRIGTHLAIFDCVTCDKCIPVCPNAANFTYELPAQALRFTDWIVAADGTLEPGQTRELILERRHQIANFADFCNECGNCDTFCPEYGGPFIEKPSFFGTLETWRRHDDRDGFHVEITRDIRRIHGRLKGAEFLLEQKLSTHQWTYSDGQVTATLAEQRNWNDQNGKPLSITPAKPNHILDMHVFHTLRLLLQALLDPSHVHQINTRPLAEDLVHP